MEIFILLLGILATWRISSLFVHEKGPFHIFSILREAIGIQHDNDDNPYAYPSGFLGELFSCVWCFSIWIGIFLAILYFISASVYVWITLPLAWSAGAILLEKNIRVD